MARFRRFHYKIKLQSTNRTFKKQLSELNETTKLLEETKRRELDCAEREERCDRILDRETVLKTNEAKLKTAHEHLKNEWKHLSESITEQVKQETDRNANVSGKTATGSVRGPAHSVRPRRGRVCILAVVMHLIYLAKLAHRISQFIKGG